MIVHSYQLHLTAIGGSSYAFYQGKKLGEGYGGAIYQGIRITDSLPVAVKILNNNSLIQSHIPLSQLPYLTSQNIIKISSLPFHHNSLVKIFDVIQMDKIFIIMQLCHCNLFELLQEKKLLTQCEILVIFKNLIEALLLIQKQGYHYSDLKPQNILISKNGQAKLGDLQSLIMLQKLDNSVSMKFRNQIFGTLNYMPPELIGLGQYSSKNCIWSLGIIMHQIIYGQFPFQAIVQGENMNQSQKQKCLDLFYQHLFQMKISQTKAKQYPKCHHLLKKMLKFNAKNRIDLQQILKIFSDQLAEKQILLLKSESNSDIKKPRTNSQNTIDTADNQTHQLNECSIDLKTTKQKLNEKHQNQKQNVYVSLNQQNPISLSMSVKFREKQSEKFLSFLKNTYEIETTKMIDSIHSPLILVKKLNQLKNLLTNLLEVTEETQQKREKKESCTMIRNFGHEIRNSKAYRHLEMTLKIQNISFQFERNQKEFTLWSHLNLLIQITTNHLSQNKSQRR